MHRKSMTLVYPRSKSRHGLSGLRSRVYVTNAWVAHSSNRSVYVFLAMFCCCNGHHPPLPRMRMAKVVRVVGAHVHQAAHLLLLDPRLVQHFGYLWSICWVHREHLEQDGHGIWLWHRAQELLGVFEVAAEVQVALYPSDAPWKRVGEHAQVDHR